MESSVQHALLTLLVIGGLVVGILRLRKMMNDPGADLRKEKERKKHPLRKIELARKQAANRAAKNKGIKK